MGLFGRLGNVMKGFFALFVRKVEKENPRALLEAEINNFHEAVAAYNKNLAVQAGMVERLKTQIAKQKKDLDSLKARTAANFQAQNLELAGRLALQAKQLQTDLAENETQFKEADEMYRNLTGQRDVFVREAQQKIESIKRKLSQTEMAEAQAKLAEMASATAFDMSGSGATLERVEQDLDERLSEAKGKARVAADKTKGGEWAVKESEQKALEAQALQEFAAAMGMAAPVAAAPAAPAVDAPARELGPEVKA